MAKMNWGRVNRENNDRRWATTKYGPTAGKKRKKKQGAKRRHYRVRVFFPGNPTGYIYSNITKAADKLGVSSWDVMAALRASGIVQSGPLTGYRIQWTTKAFKPGA